MVVITINPVPIVLELMEQSVPARFTAWHRELAPHCVQCAPLPIRHRALITSNYLLKGHDRIGDFLQHSPANDQGLVDLRGVPYHADAFRS
jgi:hypothetical protein